MVFLMLVFFLVAGTLARPLSGPGTDPDRVARPGLAPRRVLASEAVAARLVPDRAADALQVLEVAAELKAAGAERVMLVTARGVAE